MVGIHLVMLQYNGNSKIFNFYVTLILLCFPGNQAASNRDMNEIWIA